MVRCLLGAGSEMVGKAWGGEGGNDRGGLGVTGAVGEVGASPAGCLWGRAVGAGVS